MRKLKAANKPVVYGVLTVSNEEAQKHFAAKRRALEKRLEAAA